MSTPKFTGWTRKKRTKHLQYRSSKRWNSQINSSMIRHSTQSWEDASQNTWAKLDTETEDQQLNVSFFSGWHFYLGWLATCIYVNMEPFLGLFCSDSQPLTSVPLGTTGCTSPSTKITPTFRSIQLDSRLTDGSVNTFCSITCIQTLLGTIILKEPTLF